MFNWKSKSRRAYVKTVLSQFHRQKNIGSIEVDKMSLAMGALTESLIQYDVLKIPETNQLAQSYRDTLNTMTRMPSTEKKSEFWAQKCILISKQFPMSSISEKMPSLLYASYFKLSADRSANAFKRPDMKVIEERASLTNEVIESLSFLFSEFLINNGTFNAH